MASIVKRKNRYSVVYSVTDEMGNSKQKWETFSTYAEAKKRKRKIEYEQAAGTFIVPTATTISDLLEEYCAVYGVNTWAMSTYQSRKSLMYNYILPIIGDMRLDEITPRVMDKYFQSLQSVKTKAVKNKKPNTTYLSPHTIREIHKFLRSAFNQGVKWELMAKNPVLNAILPKETPKKREIWTVDILQKALNVCEDPMLALAINLSFSCSLRMGEMLGLTWDCVDISEVAMENNSASIYVNKELQRVNKDVMEMLDKKDVLQIFPHLFSNTNTALVLKLPKTKSSVRKIFLPRTVAKMLIERRKQTEEMKELFGDEYKDYNLIFCHSTGRPMEGQVINRGLKELIKKHDLPNIVFHSFRHASITYKLKWNGGDMKSVQGDSGHARMDMVADIYSHIIDEDRKFNAQTFEKQFYGTEALKAGGEISLPNFEIKMNLREESKKDAPQEEIKEDASKLISKLLKNPETAELLKMLAKAL